MAEPPRLERGQGVNPGRLSRALRYHYSTAPYRNSPFLVLGEEKRTKKGLSNVGRKKQARSLDVKNVPTVAFFVSIFSTI